MGKLWLNASGQLIGDGGSPIKLIECATCPCGPASGLYAVGRFTTSGGVTTNHVAYWNGSTWAALGSGATGGGDTGAPYIKGCFTWNNKLVVFGSFTAIDGVSATNIAQWDGTAWAAIGSLSSGNYIRDALDWNGTLVAMRALGQVPYQYSGGTWSALGASWPGS